MKPVIALIGHPNVGKSTLFNRLTKSRDALVADMPGLTRDRHYGYGDFNDHSFIVIDTGGVGLEDKELDTMVSRQTWQAVAEADRVLLVVDGRAGNLAINQDIAKQLRKQHKKVYLVVNKLDGLIAEQALADFYKLGFTDIYGIAASQGTGITTLMTAVLADLPEQAAEDESQLPGIKVAIVGRPNVGKSTLVNRLLGEERVVVYDAPGTTRDSIAIPYQRFGKDYILIDTAGVRRRGKINESVEKFSVIKTMQSIADAHVVVLLLDAVEGVVEQDLHLLGLILEQGRGLVIGINKWDGLTEDVKREVRRELDRRLVFINYADIHFISALHGTAVGHLYKSIDQSYKAANVKASPNQVTTILERLVAKNPPSLVRGKQIKLRYAHLGGSNPPRIIIHGNQTSHVPASYTRYLEHGFRAALKLKGTPVIVEFKTGKNPYAHKKNVLTSRQIAKRKRLLSKVKKKR